MLRKDRILIKTELTQLIPPWNKASSNHGESHASLVPLEYLLLDVRIHI